MARSPTENGLEEAAHKYYFNIENEDVLLAQKLLPTQYPAHVCVHGHLPRVLALVMVWAAVCTNYGEFNSRHLVAWCPAWHEHWCGKVRPRALKSVILLQGFLFLLGTVELLKAPRYRKEVDRICIMLLLFSSGKKSHCFFQVITFQKLGQLLSINSQIVKGFIYLM